MITNNNRLYGILLAVAFILAIPLVAMQFTNDVNWGFFDFLVMGFLLLTTGLTCELILRKVQKPVHRLAIIAAILFVFFLIWAELAVGIFGSPFAGS